MSKRKWKDNEKKVEDESSIVSLLKNILPTNDRINVEEELQKDFVLHKRKGKKQNNKPKKKTSITRKEKKNLGFFHIPRDAMKYEDVLPMHYMWTDYMTQLLELGQKKIPEVHQKNWDSFTLTIYKSDFHGSLLKVVRSKCPSYVDKKGICVMDTKGTFKLLSENNVITTIPKMECVFELYLKNLIIAIFGKHLCIKPAERSVKKIKCQLPFL